MLGSKQIEWAVRFRALEKGRTFISDRVILLDESYCPVDGLEEANTEQRGKAQTVYEAPSKSICFGLDDLTLNSHGNWNGPLNIMLGAPYVSFLRTLSYQHELKFSSTAEDGGTAIVVLCDGDQKIGILVPLRSPTLEETLSRTIEKLKTQAREEENDPRHTCAIGGIEAGGWRRCPAVARAFND